MLTLLKYDIQSNISRLLASVLVMIFSIVILIFASFTQGYLIEPLAMLFAIIGTIVSFGICVVSLMTGFYSSMSGNQSFLTYTIPFKTSYIVISKLIAAIIWTIACITVILLSWGIYASINGVDVFAYIAELELFTHFTLLIIIQFIYNVCLLAFCISLSVLPFFRNRGVGVLASIISYVILNAIGNVFIIVGIMVTALSKRYSLIIFNNSIEMDMVNDIIIYPSIIIYLLMTAAYLFLSIRFFDKHRSI